MKQSPSAPSTSIANTRWDLHKMPTDTLPRPNGNTYWVVPLKFLAGEYPGDEDSDKARKKIKQFLAAGIRHFVDLAELGEKTRSGKLVPYEAILVEEARNSSID